MAKQAKAAIRCRPFTPTNLVDYHLTALKFRKAITFVIQKISKVVCSRNFSRSSNMILEEYPKWMRRQTKSGLRPLAAT